MNNKRQMSESIELGIILAMAGGFMDAYSYICRGGVFSNAQTGNMLLFGVHVSEGKWVMAFNYLLPVLAFAIGIAIADIVKITLQDRVNIHWRQIAVVVEAIILVTVGFMPQSINIAANSIASLACGIQVESFRKIHGNSIATTMCIGNLRSATQNICEYCFTKNISLVKKGLLYLTVILFFVFGAVCGNIAVKIMAEKAIMICSLILFVAFLMMFIDREKQIKKE